MKTNIVIYYIKNGEKVIVRELYNVKENNYDSFENETYKIATTTNELKIFDFASQGIRHYDLDFYKYELVDDDETSTTSKN